MSLRKKVNIINPTDWNSKAVSPRKRAAAVKEKAFIYLWFELIFFRLRSRIYSFFCVLTKSREELGLWKEDLLILRELLSSNNYSMKLQSIKNDDHHPEPRWEQFCSAWCCSVTLVLEWHPGWAGRCFLLVFPSPSGSYLEISTRIPAFISGYYPNKHTPCHSLSLAGLTRGYFHWHQRKCRPNICKSKDSFKVDFCCSYI